MLLFERHSWRKWHLPWAILCAILTLLAVVWYAAAWLSRGARPGGSSLPGLTAGIVAGLLFLYLGSYALRKTVPFKAWYAWRPTKFWLGQHIWFGLLTLPLVVLHMGLWPRLSPLPLAVLGVYLVVFVSGLYGLWQQQRLPGLLLQQVPDETIPALVPDLTDRMRQEAELLVLATCGPPAGEDGMPPALEHNLGRVRDARHGKNTGLLDLLPKEPLPQTEPIRAFFRSTIAPYLESKPALSVQGKLKARWQSEFADLRKRVNPGAYPVVEALQRLCERRGELDEQAALHNRLHLWVSFHLVATVLLVLLLGWHAYSAILYW